MGLLSAALGALLAVGEEGGARLIVWVVTAAILAIVAAWPAEPVVIILTRCLQCLQVDAARRHHDES